MHPVYLARLFRRTFVLLAVMSVMKKPDQPLDDRFACLARGAALAAVPVAGERTGDDGRGIDYSHCRRQGA